MCTRTSTYDVFIGSGRGYLSQSHCFLFLFVPPTHKLLWNETQRLENYQAIKKYRYHKCTIMLCCMLYRLRSMKWDLQLKTLPLFKGHQVHLINPLKVTPPISLFGQVHLHTHNTCKMSIWERA